MDSRPTIAALLVALLGAGAAGAAPVMLPGGGPGRTDCMAALVAAGTAFPAGRPLAAARGLLCADGDDCDAAPAVGVCDFQVSVCVNALDAALPRCIASTVRRVRLRQRGPKRDRVDLTALQAAIAALPLPAEGTVCTDPVTVSVPLRGPNRKGVVQQREVRLELRSRGRGGRRDRDRFRLVCGPGGAGPDGGDGTIVLTRTPGAGLAATIVAARVDAAGVPSIDFRLTDAFGVPVGPTTAATDNPDWARVRFALARLEPNEQTREGMTAGFPRYRNYYTSRQTASTGEASDQPTYETRGTLTMLDGDTGLFRYTFGTPLPAGWPATLTHTVGAQIERTYQGETLVANPVFDFVPAGGTPAPRESAATAECNDCHGTLQAHGGGRRELRLCQLCHTDQATDPDTGNTLDLAVMVHRIHRGKDLPSVRAAVGAKYEIVGFQGARHVFGERVTFCAGGPTPLAACTSDADCAPGTCVESDGGTIVTEGVGFPQDLRNCDTCHATGATAAAHRERPSAAACAACHDDVNPGETATAAGPPGTNHVAGAQPDAFCHLCHTATGEEFDASVPGAHTNPQRSAQLPGFVAEILGVTGSGGGPVVAGSPIEVRFRLTDGAGTPLATAPSSLRLGLALSGPTTDFGGASTPFLTASSNAPSLPNVTGPDGSGTFVWAVPGSSSPPADATGTWRVGLEARRTTRIAGEPCATDADCGGAAGACSAGRCALDVTEAAQNPVFDFAIGGGAATPRRTVVAAENCANCHGTFSVDLNVHGGSRNRVEYCVVCHNPNVSDFARRRHAIAGGALATTETIHLKALLHRLHTGEDLERSFTVYGFGAAPANHSPHSFNHLRYPRDRRDCAACHVDGSELLPLPAGVLPTRTSEVSGSGGTATETVTGSQPATAAACLSCHDGDLAAIHAETNTTGGGVEACAVCHGPGKIADVATVHQAP